MRSARHSDVSSTHSSRRITARKPAGQAYHPTRANDYHNMFIDDLLRVCQASCRQLILSPGLAAQRSPSVLEGGWREHTRSQIYFWLHCAAKNPQKSAHDVATCDGKSSHRMERVAPIGQSCGFNCSETEPQLKGELATLEVFRVPSRPLWHC